MYTGKLKKVDGKLTHTRRIDINNFEQLIRSLPDGAEVDVYMDLVTDDGSLAQLAKIHAMIRDLANFTGNSAKGMKLLVKEEAGLCFVKEGELICHSFENCSKDQLSLAIQACIDLGIKVGLNLN